MQPLSLKEEINIGGKTFYHYSLGRGENCKVR